MPNIMVTKTITISREELLEMLSEKYGIEYSEINFHEDEGCADGGYYIAMVRVTGTPTPAKDTQ